MHDATYVKKRLFLKDMVKLVYVRIK